MRCTLVMILLVLSGFSLYPQEYNFTRIDSRNGLPSDWVGAVIQDQNGFVWVGTDQGLVRYDGNTFETIQDSVGNKFIINFLFESSDGFIWVATDENGLVAYDPQSTEFHYYLHDPDNPSTIAGNRVKCITEDAEGNIWLGLDNEAGISVLNRNTGLFKRYNPFVDFPFEVYGRYYQSIHGIINDPTDQNIMWMGGAVGLFSFNKKEETFQFHKNEKYRPDLNRKPHIWHIEWESKNKIRVGYFSNEVGWWAGTAVYDRQARKWENLPTGTNVPYRILGFTRKSATEYWIGARKLGFGILDTDQQSFQKFETNPDKRSTVQDGYIQSVYGGDNGKIWVFGRKGISYYDPNADYFTKFQLDFSGKEQGRITCFQDNGKRVYLSGFAARGIWQFDKATGESKLYRLPFSHQVDIIDLMLLNQKVYALHENGIYEFSIADNQVKELPIYLDSLESRLKPRFRAFQVANDSVLLIGTRLNGMMSYDLKSFQLKGFYDAQGNPLAGPENTSIEKLNEREFLISTGRNKSNEARLMKFNFTTQITEVIKLSSGVAGKRYATNELKVSKNGDVWIGTNDGIRLLREEEEFILDQTNSDFAGTIVRDIDLDDQGNLWVLHNLGLSWIDGKSLEIRNFDITDGFGAIYGLKYIGEDQLLTGIDGGFKLIDAKKLLKEGVGPKTYLQKIKVLDEEIGGKQHVDYQNQVLFEPHQNFFSFTFTSPQFTRPDLLRFAYQLDGFDKEWKIAGKDRQANYTNVGPGTYTFQVKAKMRNGDWGEIRKISIKVLPPFWRKGWFILLIVVAVGLSVFAFYRYQLKQALKTEKFKTSLEKRLAEVQMTALRAQMNPHFLFNALNSINSYIIKNKVREATEYIAKFSTLIRMVLNNSQSHLVSLTEELDTLKIYIELEALRFDHRFSYQFDVPENIESDHLEIPPMLIQPYVENAIWHGLLHKSGDRNLVISVRKKNSKIIIEIRDNGIGRKAAMEIKSKNAVRKKSFGMKISADRLKVMKEIYQTEIQLEIADLYDEENRPAGTAVYITIPIYE